MVVMTMMLSLGLYFTLLGLLLQIPGPGEHEVAPE